MGKEWKKAAVLGGGSFGTSLAELVARRGQEVMLWVRRTEQAEAINSTRRNPQYLSDFELNPLLKATSSLDDALKDADWVIVAVPSQALRSNRVSSMSHERCCQASFRLHRQQQWPSHS